MSITLFWIPATLVAVFAQTARNTMQHRLTETIGTLGATQVRFLYGLPFALVFLAVVCLIGGQWPSAPTPAFLLYVTGGALTQILATALMLAAMRQRSFSLALTYTKTEPVQVAVFGVVVLGDLLTPLAALAIGLATLGVVLMSMKPGGTDRGERWRPALLGMAAGGFFALSAIGFRGAIMSLEEGSFVLRASTGLAWGLAIQTIVLLAWLGAFQRAALSGSLRIWRRSLLAGFMGALASQFWFIGFALTAAANVRTLALLEVVLAQIVSRRLFSEQISRREIAGVLLVVAGVAVLLATGA
jgi:drug/metabolite transporter (DMT)-like permease